MDKLSLTYSGGDLVIPQAQLEALGLKPGDELTLSAAAPPDPAAERQEIEGVLKELAGSWGGEAKDAERELRKLLDKLKPGD